MLLGEGPHNVEFLEGSMTALTDTAHLVDSTTTLPLPPSRRPARDRRHHGAAAGRPLQAPLRRAAEHGQLSGAGAGEAADLHRGGEAEMWFSGIRRGDLIMWSL